MVIGKAPSYHLQSKGRVIVNLAKKQDCHLDNI